MAPGLRQDDPMTGVPSRERPQRPRAHRSAPATPVAAVLLAAALLAACDAPDRTPPSPSASSPDPGQTAAELESLTNDARADEGLTALPHSDCAATAAAERAAALVGDPDLPHAPMAPVLAACEVGVAGENLSRATTPADAVAVVDAWLASPGHRSNILDPQYTATGVACVPDGDAVLCSQVFLGE